jgi:hypothetical protein
MPPMMYHVVRSVNRPDHELLNLSANECDALIP